MDPNATAGGVASHSYVLPPAFVQDPAAFLTSIASQQPSRNGLAHLAGPIAKLFVAAAPKRVIDSTESNGEQTAEDFEPAVHFASHYLRAAAVQLQDTSQAAGNVDQEMLKTKHQYEVLEAVGAAAALCSNRTAIFSTGILPTLAHLMLHGQATEEALIVSAAASTRPSLSSNNDFFPSSLASYPPIQQAGVEFLQCAILSEHYRYAARFVQGTWPTPTKTVNIKSVLRYYYLRGLVHMGCGDVVMAHRCWWTCLAVPAESCSTIMVAAWKKLSLTQPLLDRCRGISNMFIQNSSGAVSTRLPSSVSKAMIKFLTTGKDNRDEGVLLYAQLGPATEACKIDIVSSLIENHEALLKADGNHGLAQQCLSRVEKNLVWEAAQLFSVVTVERLAQRWKIPAEEVPNRLLKSQISCRIESDGMVIFGSDDMNAIEIKYGKDVPTGIPQPSRRPPLILSWSDLSDWMQLLERLQHLDTSISTSAKFQAATTTEGKGRDSSVVESSVMSMFPRAVQDL